MATVRDYLDCGCAFMDNGQRVVCPTCEADIAMSQGPRRHTEAWAIYQEGDLVALLAAEAHAHAFAMQLVDDTVQSCEVERVTVRRFTDWHDYVLDPG